MFAEHVCHLVTVFVRIVQNFPKPIRIKGVFCAFYACDSVFAHMYIPG